LNPRLLNRGFLYGCAAAILFILGKVAKYGGGTSSKEAFISLLVILASACAGGLLWWFGRSLFCGDRHGNGRGRDDRDRAN
jgi:hypothetical protein